MITYQRKHKRTQVEVGPTEALRIPSNKQYLDSSAALTSPSSLDPPSLSFTELDLPIAHRKCTRSTGNPQYSHASSPIYKFLNYNRLFAPYIEFLSSLDFVFVPRSLTDALSHLG